MPLTTVRGCRLRGGLRWTRVHARVSFAPPDLRAPHAVVPLGAHASHSTRDAPVRRVRAQRRAPFSHSPPAIMRALALALFLSATPVLANEHLEQSLTI